ncbi:hypothetical protein ACWIG4_32585 [Streptomyces sp. NPDC002248]
MPHVRDHELRRPPESATGIPGTAGEAPVQNTGAYGQQIGDLLRHVTAWDWKKKRTVEIPRAACGLGYRTSRFKQARGGSPSSRSPSACPCPRRAAPVTSPPLCA